MRRVPLLLVFLLTVGAPATPCLGQTVSLGGVTFTAKGLVGVGRIAASQRDAAGETFGSFSGLALDRATWRRSADGASYVGTLYSLPDREIGRAHV